MLRLAGILEESIVDGEGIRFVVFAQGCKHNCKGCFNEETHDFNGGKDYSIDQILEAIQKNPLLKGVTLSGGDPFEQAEGFGELARRVKGLGLDLWIYTGYTYEQLIASSDKFYSLLKEADVLVDGKFELEEKSLLINFRGSKNQRIIDVKASLSSERVITLNYDKELCDYNVRYEFGLEANN